MINVPFGAKAVTNPLTYNIYGDDQDFVATSVPIDNNFLLLNGQDFLLLSGDQFDLLGG